MFHLFNSFLLLLWLLTCFLLIRHSLGFTLKSSCCFWVVFKSRFSHVTLLSQIGICWHQKEVVLDVVDYQVLPGLLTSYMASDTPCTCKIWRMDYSPYDNSYSDLYDIMYTPEYSKNRYDEVVSHIKSRQNSSR